MASTWDKNHNMKAFLGFFSTSRMLLTLFFRSWFSVMVQTIIMIMASSTGVKDLSLFLEQLDRVEVGVMPVKAVKSVKLMEAVMQGAQQAPHLRGWCSLPRQLGGLKSDDGPAQTQ